MASRVKLMSLPMMRAPFVLYSWMPLPRWDDW